MSNKRKTISKEGKPLVRPATKDEVVALDKSEKKHKESNTLVSSYTKADRSKAVIEHIDKCITYLNTPKLRQTAGSFHIRRWLATERFINNKEALENNVT